MRASGNLRPLLKPRSSRELYFLVNESDCYQAFRYKWSAHYFLELQFFKFKGGNLIPRAHAFQTRESKSSRFLGDHLGNGLCLRDKHSVKHTALISYYY